MSKPIRVTALAVAAILLVGAGFCLRGCSRNRDALTKYKEELLYNRYQAGRDQIRRYESNPPYAYVIPQQQRDPVAPVELLRRLAYNGVAVSQLTAAATVDGNSYPAGTWVIPMNQPFAELARQLLEVQVYPDLREYPEGPPDQPYDAAGWTLPIQMGVTVVEAKMPLTAEFKAALKPLGPGAKTVSDDSTEDAATFDSVPGAGFDSSPLAAAIVPPAGKITGSGPAIAFNPWQKRQYVLYRSCPSRSAAAVVSNRIAGTGAPACP